MSQFGVILALIFSLVIAIFAIANNQPIQVNYLYGKAEVSAIVVILGAAILGALVIFLLSLFRQIRIGFQIRSLRHEVDNYKNKTMELEKERERLMAQVEQLSDLNAGGQTVVTVEHAKTGPLTAPTSQAEDHTEDTASGGENDDSLEPRRASHVEDVDSKKRAEQDVNNEDEQNY